MKNVGKNKKVLGSAGTAWNSRFQLYFASHEQSTQNHQFVIFFPHGNKRSTFIICICAHVFASLISHIDSEVEPN